MVFWSYIICFYLQWEKHINKLVKLMYCSLNWNFIYSKNFHIINAQYDLTKYIFKRILPWILLQMKVDNFYQFLFIIVQNQLKFFLFLWLFQLQRAIGNFYFRDYTKHLPMWRNLKVSIKINRKYQNLFIIVNLWYLYVHRFIFRINLVIIIIILHTI